MDYNLLLAYLSELGSGNWTEFRSATDWLTPERFPDEKAWMVARRLSALGHIEVSWGSEIEWCATPPVVTMIPRSGGRALVTGGRTRTFLATGSAGQTDSGTLVDAVDEAELFIDRVRQPAGPTGIYVACESEMDARGLAARLDVAFTYSVARQLAAVLPELNMYFQFWTDGELPLNFDVERFDVDSLQWVADEEPSGLGVFRAKSYERTLHVLHGPVPGQWRSVDREHAVYVALDWAEKSVLRYSPTNLGLEVPIHASLPVLQERAAVLSSGKLPPGPVIRDLSGTEVQMLVYSNVDLFVAEEIARSLRQELVIA